MLAKRIIPCLDVTGGRVVKGVHFVGLSDAGDPVELASRYNDQGADELVFLDITASSDARAIMADVVARTARKVFIPLTVGGGIRSVADARKKASAEIRPAARRQKMATAVESSRVGTLSLDSRAVARPFSTSNNTVRASRPLRLMRTTVPSGAFAFLART